MATERYRDFYGCRASIKTNDLTGEATLRIPTPPVTQSPDTLLTLPHTQPLPLPFFPFF